jgi:hypothetical protein
MIKKLLLIGMLALVLVFVFSGVFSHTVYAYEGADEGENNSSGDKWGGDTPGSGTGPGAVEDPGYSGQPGGKP